MRRTLVALLLLAAAGYALAPDAQGTETVSRARARDVSGTWTGQWMADDESRGGAVEMIVTVSADQSIVVAQVTFVDGGMPDTARREGRLTRAGLFFDLVGGGAMVLTLEPSHRLTGEFAGGQDVPVRRGSLELSRKS